MIGKSVIIYTDCYGPILPTYIVNVKEVDEEGLVGDFVTLDRNGNRVNKIYDFENVDGRFLWEWVKRLDIIDE